MTLWPLLHSHIHTACLRKPPGRSWIRHEHRILWGYALFFHTTALVGTILNFGPHSTKGQRDTRALKQTWIVLYSLQRDFSIRYCVLLHDQVFTWFWSVPGNSLVSSSLEKTQLSKPVHKKSLRARSGMTMQKKDFKGIVQAKQLHIVLNMTKKSD